MADLDGTDSGSALRNALGFPKQQHYAPNDHKSPAASPGASDHLPPSPAGRPSGPDGVADLLNELTQRVAGLESSVNDAITRVADEAVNRASSDVIARLRQELIDFSERLAHALAPNSPPPQ